MLSKVSIIVPIYNTKKYLEKCITSILSQTYSNIEVILVDDGSQDGSGELCDKYAAIDDRVRVIHKSNEGVSVARNAALKIMTGKYVTFCDSDDYISDNWIEMLVKTALEEKADVVLGNFNVISTSDESIRNRSLSAHKEGQIEINNSGDRFKRLCNILYLDKCGWEVWTRLFDAKIIFDNNIRFCECCENYAEDLGFVLEYNLYCHRIVSIKHRGYNYVLRDSSIMSKSVGKVYLNRLCELSYYFKPKYDKCFLQTNYLKKYGVIHSLMLYTQLNKIIGTQEYSNIKYYFGTIEKQKFNKKMLRSLYKDYFTLKNFYGKNIAKQAILLAHYCIHQNWRRFSYESAIAYFFIGR